LLWEAWNLSQTYNTRPSVILGISEGFPAFCIDRATAYFASVVTEHMDEVEGALPKGASKQLRDSTRQGILNGYLGIEEEVQGKYRELKPRG